MSCDAYVPRVTARSMPGRPAMVRRVCRLIELRPSWWASGHEQVSAICQGTPSLPFDVFGCYAMAVSALSISIYSHIFISALGKP